MKTSMKTAYQRLADLCKSAKISKTEMAKMLGYKDQQSMARASAKKKVCRNFLTLFLKVAPFFDDLDWTICNGCGEPLNNSEIIDNMCPVCGENHI